MKLRAATVLPVLALGAAAGLVGTAFSAGGGANEPVLPEPAAPVAAPARTVLLVPDVRRQPYVFAKGILDDAGFAWKVVGKVGGFAGNVVAEQRPAPGTLVEDTGMPLVTLRLRTSKGYEQRGVAKNASSYRGTKIVAWRKDSAPEPPPALGEIPPAEPVEAASETPGPEPAPPAAPAGDEGADEHQADAAEAAAGREPDFVVPGAPPEPPNELPLVKRALKLQAKLARAETPTDALVDHWLFQHNWIVTGALFGWNGGEAALETLIAIDEDLQARWGLGARSERVARDALAEVKERSR